jgi:hypothetical protein
MSRVYSMHAGDELVQNFGRKPEEKRRGRRWKDR